MPTRSAGTAPRWRSGSAWGRAAGPGTHPAYDTAPHLTRGDPMQEPAAVLTAARDNAAQVDRDGAFPQAAVDALRRLGLLGLTLPVEGGGMGRGRTTSPRCWPRLAATWGLAAVVPDAHLEI